MKRLNSSALLLSAKFSFRTGTTAAKACATRRPALEGTETAMSTQSDPVLRRGRGQDLEIVPETDCLSSTVKKPEFPQTKGTGRLYHYCHIMSLLTQDTQSSFLVPRAAPRQPGPAGAPHGSPGQRGLLRARPRFCCRGGPGLSRSRASAVPAARAHAATRTGQRRPHGRCHSDPAALRGREQPRPCPGCSPFRGPRSRSQPGRAPRSAPQSSRPMRSAAPAGWRRCLPAHGSRSPRPGCPRHSRGRTHSRAPRHPQEGCGGCGPGPADTARRCPAHLRGSGPAAAPQAAGSPAGPARCPAGSEPARRGGRGRSQPGRAAAGERARGPALTLARVTRCVASLTTAKLPLPMVRSIS